MFRSQTDEQLAARHDPAPFERNGIRSDTAEHAYGEWKHAPRVECIPSRNNDPFPRQSHTYPDPDPAWNVARPPVNRVLVAFREVGHSALEYLNGMSVQTYVGAPQTTSDEIDHARRVLTKLKGVYDA